MVYVALLRGINVGGNNKIPMMELKKIFEKTNMQSVTTYINSGNVVFKDVAHSKYELEALLHQAILAGTQLEISVLVRNLDDYAALMAKLPPHWKNDGEMKSDVLFLSGSVDREEILGELTIKPDIDRVLYVSGAILWSVDRKNAARSGLLKVVGSALYHQMTIRNVNTTRKIFEIMNRT
ncbi:DUF1697 domain-containing protein [Anoxynatronum buryatiense]|uniref:Uncharacterized conserved protein, DUF1697 family n=1 Tax=Anoxynatronum buryatiense TaxID=489973 RepID=A0AA45X0G0_9CLOT|nr:DUF1697 domain-containing protein [Anoxynatronum buryatiense]SMP72154.1 Uncharacterized conserved protein, DUF1697 family [Anoxynatronum buryatiense]